MANIKLTNNYWETSGIYDLTESKTQRVINSELKGAINEKMPDSSPADLNNLPTGKPVVVPYHSSNTLNVPTTDRHGYCVHFASSANYAVQMAQAVGEHDIYVRKKSGGTWDAWTHIGDGMTFVVTGTTLASKSNTTFCTTAADGRVTASTNVAKVTFLDPTVLTSSTYTVTTNANGTVTLTGSTASSTTTAIIECYN